MTDERQAAKMVQYHIEGEHVFPEPECPSCRLVEALRRAAESVRLLRSDKDDAHQGRYLAGWAEAIRAHAERPESEHDGGCSTGISKAPCKCSQRDRTEAIAKFCDTVLGEE